MDLGLDVVSRFHRTQFSPGAIREFATELNFTAKMVAFLRSELDLRSRDPSDLLVRWVLDAEGMYEGRVVASVVERFRPVVKNSLQIVLRDIVRRSVAAAPQDGRLARTGRSVGTNLLIGSFGSTPKKCIRPSKKFWT